MVNNMRHVFTRGNPMEIHHQMAVAYAHFVPGFLAKKLMTPEMADAYDKAQEEKTAKYKVPEQVRKDGCHYGRYLKEE